jgi:hypothetical protein
VKSTNYKLSAVLIQSHLHPHFYVSLEVRLLLKLVGVGKGEHCRGWGWPSVARLLVCVFLADRDGNPPHTTRVLCGSVVGRCFLVSVCHNIISTVAPTFLPSRTSMCVLSAGVAGWLAWWPLHSYFIWPDSSGPTPINTSPLYSLRIRCCPADTTFTREIPHHILSTPHTHTHTHRLDGYHGYHGVNRGRSIPRHHYTVPPACAMAAALPWP